MKKIILYLAFILMSITSCYAFASEEDSLQSEQITLQESTEDIAHKFILGTFGKDALQWFEPKDIIDLDDYKDTNDIKKMTSPFPYIYMETQFLYYLIIMFSISSFIIYSSWIMFGGLYKSQHSGEFLGNSWNKTFLVVKFFISLSLILPFAGDEQIQNRYTTQLSEMFPVETNNSFNLGQMFAFKIAGLSNHFGNKINNVVMDYQPRVYPSLAIPENDAKYDSAKVLVNFMLCIKTSPSVKGDITLKMKANGEQITGNILTDDNSCNLKISFGLDKEGSNIANNNDFVKSVVGDFEQKQINAIGNSLKGLFKNADNIANNLLAGSQNRVIKENQQESVFYEHLKTNQSNLDNINYWEKNCDKIINYNATTGLSEEELKQYAYLSTRCLALEVNKSLIFPNNRDIITYVMNDNYLKSNHIELCSHDFQDMDTTKSKTIIGDQNFNIETLDDNLNFSLNYKNKTIENCVTESCSNLDQEYSNLYMCSNAISLYKKIKEDDKFRKYGFFTLGANVYRLFSSHDSLSAKNIYNKFKIENFSFVSKTINSFNASDVQDPDLSIKIPYTKVDNGLSALKDEVISFDHEKINDKYFRTKADEDIFSKMLNMDTVGVMSEFNLLGSKRLIECIKNPLRVSNGYSCNSVPEEYNYFGNNLINFYIQAKTLNALMMVKYDIPHKAGGGIEEDGKASKVGLAFKASSILLKYLGIPALTDYLLENKLTTDEFGNMNSKEISSYRYSEEALIIIKELTNKFAPVSLIFDIALGTIFILGILFAFLIPFTPFYICLGLLFEWCLLLFQTIMIVPLWSVYILKQTRDHTSDVLTMGLKIFLTLFLKIPFMIIGVILAWIMANTVMSRTLSLFDFNEIVNVRYGESITGIVDSIVMLIVYGVLIYVITNLMVSIMDKFYNFATQWITNGAGNVGSAQDKSYGALTKIRGHANRSKNMSRNVLKIFGKRG